MANWDVINVISYTCASPALINLNVWSVKKKKRKGFSYYMLFGSKSVMLMGAQTGFLFFFSLILFLNFFLAYNQ